MIADWVTSQLADVCNNLNETQLNKQCSSERSSSCRMEFEAFGVLKGVVKAARAGDEPDKMITFRNAFAAGYSTAANGAEVRP